MAAQIQETESQNFHRLVSILIDNGSEVLRKLLMKYALQQTTSFDQFLTNHKTILETLQNKRHILNQSQMDLIFPAAGPANIETMDITLLSCLLRNICGQLPMQEKQGIEELRKSRNSISGHMAKAAISYNDFKTLWTKISNIINTLAKCCGDVPFAQKVQADLNSAWTSPKLIPSSQFTDLLLRWINSDTHLKSELHDIKDATQQVEREIAEVGSDLKVVKEQTKDLDRAQSKMKSDFERVGSKTEEINKAQTEIKSELKHMKMKTDEIKNVQVEMKRVYTKTEEMYRQQADMMSRVDTITKTTEGLKDSVMQQGYHIDPALDRLKKNSKQFILSKLRNNYVQTRLMKEAERNLLGTGSCVIAGKPGEGKTTAAVTIINDHFKLERCLVLSDPRDWSVVDIEEMDVIFIDDIFGIYNLDEGRLAEWIGVLDTISACTGIKKGQVKVIIATRAGILNECRAKLSRFTIFQNIVEFSSDKLGKEEKVSMLEYALQNNQKTLSKAVIEKCVEKFTSPIGFPFCCQLFSSDPTLFDRREKFFVKPFKFFKDNLLTLQKDKTAALIFLFYREGFLDTRDLVDKNKAYCRDLKEISVLLNISQPLQPSMVEECLHQMKGTYTTYSKGIFTFVHNSVSEAVGLVYGKINPSYVIRACSSQFLHQCTSVEQELDKEEDKKVLVPFQCYTVLAQRLIAEVIDRKEVVRTASHTALQNGSFLSVFLQTIGAQKCMKLFLTTKQPNVHKQIFLLEYVKVIYKSNNINAGKNLSAVLCTLGKCSHLIAFTKERCWKCKIKNECLNACCECGLSVSACRLLLQHGALPDIETINCSVRGGNSDVVRSILDCGPEPSAESLDFAVRGGKIDIVMLLLERGALANSESLNSATRGVKGEIFRVLLDSGAVPDEDTMYWAIQVNSLNFVKAILEHGYKPDAKSVKQSLRKGNVDITKGLVEHGAVPDIETVNSAIKERNRDLFEILMANMPATVPYLVPLCSTIRWGNLEAVRLLLDHGAVPERRSLNMAVSEGNAEIVKSLIEHVNDNSLCQDALTTAIKESNVDVVEVLLQHGTVPNTMDVNMAIWRGNVDVLRASLKHIPEPDPEFLTCAVQGGRVDVIRCLLELGAVPNKLTLKYAIRGGNFDVVKPLLEHVTAPEKDHLNYAVTVGNVDIVQAIIEGGAMPDRETLKFAMRGTNEDIVRLVMENGVVPDIEILNNATSIGNFAVFCFAMGHGVVPEIETLNIAVNSGNIDMISLLLGHGVAPDRAILNSAVTKGNVDILKLIMTHEAGVEPDREMLTRAIIVGNTDIVKTVLKYGAVPDTEALKMAVWDGNVDIVKKLMEHGAKPDAATLNCAEMLQNVDIITALLKQMAGP